MSDQVWKVPVSPAQRLILIRLAHHQEQKIKGGSAGRVFRRFMRAFALDRIRDVLRANKDTVNGKCALDDTPSLFEITVENAEQALKLQDLEHGAADEMTLGPLLDVLDDLKSGKPYEPPADVPAFDPAADDWTPLAVKDPVEEAVEKIAKKLEANGFADAAKIVRGGSWEALPVPSATPAQPTTPNGTPA